MDTVTIDGVIYAGVILILGTIAAVGLWVLWTDIAGDQ